MVTELGESLRASAGLTVSGDEASQGRVGHIPVRNLWLLMLYASDLFRAQGRRHVEVEDAPDELPDLVGEILARAVEERRRRQFSPGFRPHEAVVSRVRGRIDVLRTATHQLEARGQVACRFEQLTVDTPRNRFVRAALESIARLVRAKDLARRCRGLASLMREMGVSGVLPSRAELSMDRLGRNDANDRVMVAAARLALDLALPTEGAGQHALLAPEREIAWVRRLFEQAVGSFYDVVLGPQGWEVRRGSVLHWPVNRQTPGLAEILPSMKTDVVLEHAASGRRIVIDTKFNALLAKGWYREESLRSGYLYQMYAYLRSQAGRGDVLADRAEGLLLHPSVGTAVDECMALQGHTIRFATIDLTAPPTEIRARLIALTEIPSSSLLHRQMP